MNNDHIEKSLNPIRSFFQRASARIESMKQGERIPATQLAADLAVDMGKTGPQVYPLLLLLLPEYPGIEVTRGSKGGIKKL